jgi:hypothetical protein
MLWTHAIDTCIIRHACPNRARMPKRSGIGKCMYFVFSFIRIRCKLLGNCRKWPLAQRPLCLQGEWGINDSLKSSTAQYDWSPVTNNANGWNKIAYVVLCVVHTSHTCSTFADGTGTERQRFGLYKLRTDIPILTRRKEADLHPPSRSLSCETSTLSQNQLGAIAIEKLRSGKAAAFAIDNNTLRTGGKVKYWQMCTTVKSDNFDISEKDSLSKCFW